MIKSDKLFYKNTKQYTWAHARDNILSFARLHRFHCFTNHTVTLSSVKSKSAWHFNKNVLSDAHFKSLRKWWEFGEVQIKEICQQYNHNVTKDIIISVKALENKILKLQEAAQSSTNRTDIDTTY